LGPRGPTQALLPWLDAGSWFAVATAVAGIVFTIVFRRETGAINDRESGRRYGIIVGIEFGLAGVGAAILGVTGAAEFIPVWICLVVGVHFFPLAPVLCNRLLIPLGVVTSAVAVTALVVALTTDIRASAVTGVGAGAALLAVGLYSLWRVARSR
jgi:hypothetical protein